MNVDLFMVTFRRDIEYTRFALMSIQKFARGFRQLVIVVPAPDLLLFTELAREVPGPIPVSIMEFKEQPGKGMLHHMVVVCSADLFSDADFMVHIDADCIFCEPVTPDDYFVRGKPVMLKELFSRMSGPVLNWQIAVEKALGWKPAHETMRRHPSVHPRWLYSAMRATVEAVHRMEFEVYVLSCKNEYPQTFAEFPTLGAWALRYAPWAHHWVEVGQDQVPTNKLKQFWTHGSVDMMWGDDRKESVRQIVERILS